MDREPAFGGSIAGAVSTRNPASAQLESAVIAAHQTTDKIADKATVQVDRVSGTVHRAVNNIADAAITTANWAAAVPERAQEAKTKLTESACNSIRARPLGTVAGALAVGYLLGRLARL
jgi:hypothetical protein